MKVFLTHPPDFRRQYYGERSLHGLQALADVTLHAGDQPLDANGLVAAARDADIIVSDRMTEGRGETFAKLPKLRAVVRCAVDIRNIDVGAATAAGVLVTRASPGFKWGEVSSSMRTSSLPYNTAAFIFRIQSSFAYFVS